MLLDGCQAIVHQVVDVSVDPVEIFRLGKQPPLGAFGPQFLDCVGELGFYWLLLNEQPGG